MPSIFDLHDPRMIGTSQGIMFYADAAVPEGEAWVISETCAVVGNEDAKRLLPELVRVFNLAPFPARALSDKPWTIAALVPE